MRITTVDTSNVPPIQRFFVEGLSNVVVLAGPNGVGKTRLVDAMLQAFRMVGHSGDSDPIVRFVIEATTPEETSQWGKAILNTAVQNDASRLNLTLQGAKRRRNYSSSIIQFESDRSIQQVNPYAPSWDFSDPWDEIVSWHLGVGRLRDRFQDTQHAIFRKVQSRKSEISDRAISLMNSGKKRMPLDFSDPLLPFKHAFSQLLAPKELVDPDPRHQNLRYYFDGQTLPIDSLSSGEREVVNIVFDFVLRNASHSVIFFDEPELHLHPELSHKLLQTLSSVGETNQFFFLTHSPEIITASLQHSVIFLAPPKGPGINQAIVVQENDQTHQALKLLGQSVGIISLGKKLVLIEGEDTSLDKRTYGAILKDRFPNLVLVPSGGKELIHSFSSAVTSVLAHAIWGVEFFMLCDRDALPDPTNAMSLEAEAAGRLKLLKRYHLENYFLDENVLAAIFANMEPEGAELRDPIQIRVKLKQIARDIMSYATALTVSADLRMRAGNVDIMPKGCHGKSLDELSQLMLDRAKEELVRINGMIASNEIEAAVQSTFLTLEQSLNDDTETWKALIPGKQVLNRFAHFASLDVGRLKTMYIAEADKHMPNPFADIIAIFEHFNSLSI